MCHCNSDMAEIFVQVTPPMHSPAQAMPQAHKILSRGAHSQSAASLSPAKSAAAPSPTMDVCRFYSKPGGCRPKSGTCPYRHEAAPAAFSSKPSDGNLWPASAPAQQPASQQSISGSFRPRSAGTAKSNPAPPSQITSTYRVESDKVLALISVRRPAAALTLNRRTGYVNNCRRA